MIIQQPFKSRLNSLCEVEVSKFAQGGKSDGFVQAGNSGLCGGSVPMSDEIILLTSRLNQIISFDDVSSFDIGSTPYESSTLI